MSDDERLYFQFIEGDIDALEKLVVTYRNHLVIFINSYVNDLNDAEDLAEDVFVQLIVKKPSFKRKSDFKTWLFSIARHLSLNFLKKRSKSICCDVTELQSSSIENSPDELFMMNEEKKYLHQKLRSIKIEYRQVIILSYFEEFSNSEIAFIMKKTKRQIENLLYRAKISLKNELIKLEDDKLEEL